MVVGDCSVNKDPMVTSVVSMLHAADAAPTAIAVRHFTGRSVRHRAAHSSFDRPFSPPILSRLPVLGCNVGANKLNII